ncbi:MAG TPA: CoA ester lyase [Candidatus Saccharimonadales bacterium]|jgi:citrate lyase subunit beta/citryl-CoA lyase|nr:CoA ester lyase [Candidatus Saccharimonadales bacterium]
MPLLNPRSYLFVPGTRPDRFPKACAAGADVVILDLEDSVAPADKTTARAAISEWLSAALPVMVRVNTSGSEWFRDDLTLAKKTGLVGVLLPKAERLEEIRLVAESFGPAMPILPQIETARGFRNARTLAGAQNVKRLLFGSIDFQLDLGMLAEEDELLYFRSQIVLDSRLAGILPPVDGVTTDINSPDRVRADTLRARRLGFGGKMCIHPKQVPIVNECFAPTDQEVAWATRVVEASAAAPGAAISVDGKMVDRPVLARAEAILSIAAQLRTQ